MAVTKNRKNELVALYREWAINSQAVIVVEYSGLTMKNLDTLRSKVREAGGEFHVVKNTLGKLAFSAENFVNPEKLFQGSTAVAFAKTDPPALAKAFSEFARTSEFLKIKGGYLGKDLISIESVQALADLPPLPVVRGQLLGTIMAPASQLARILAEPARMLASVVKAYSDKEATPAVA